MAYTLGIVIRASSIGFAGVDVDQKRILFSGVHAFDPAENPKDGSSLALPRRQYRSLRRRTQRRAQRKKQIRSLLRRHGLPEIEHIEQSPAHSVSVSPWDLRKAAFERRLEDAEFSRVLFHIAKHRGFKSLKKDADNDEASNKIVKNALDLRKKALQAGARSIAAYLATQGRQRNRALDYSHCILREDLHKEVNEIFEAQYKLGNAKATSALLQEYAGTGRMEDRGTLKGEGVAFFQRPLQSVDHQEGKCELIRGDACLWTSLVGETVKNKDGLTLPPIESVRNPRVLRSFVQARKIINACLRRYGPPETIFLELGRDLGKSFADRRRKAMEKRRNDLDDEAERATYAQLFGISRDIVQSEDLLKYHLWKEQDGFCPYSGYYITPDQLTDPTATQIDHILPLSRSWDHSSMNKILCLAYEGRNKGQQTAFEYLSGKTRMAHLEAFGTKLPKQKAERLLHEKFKSVEQSWRERSIRDERPFSRALQNQLGKHYSPGEPGRVQTRKSWVTDHLIESWGLSDSYSQSLKLQALKAILLACISENYLHRFFSREATEPWLPTAKNRAESSLPWDMFIEEAHNSVNAAFVSRQPKRTIKGSAHKDTIRRIRKSDGAVIQRVKLKDLKLAQLERLVDKHRNLKLYDLLKNRLLEHADQPKRAFLEPIFMPVNDPSKVAPQILSVRVKALQTSGIPVRQGSARNGDMVRVDVFATTNLKGKKEYFLCPVYVHHFAQAALPNKVIAGGKDEKGWPTISGQDFLFSLYRNDLVRYSRNGEDFFYGYYVGTDRVAATIDLLAHDADLEISKEGMIQRLGVKTLHSLEKYQVDYFGIRYAVPKETRLGRIQRLQSHKSESGLKNGTTA